MLSRGAFVPFESTNAITDHDGESVNRRALSHVLADTGPAGTPLELDVQT